jgi:RNA polymerase sigma-70 factor (ECF subfamily)
MGAISMAMSRTSLTGHAKAVDASVSMGAESTTRERELESIYRKYGGMVRRRCLAILHDPQDADDAMQEVFIRAIRSLGSFRGNSSPATWLYRIATNICLNRIRDSRNRERLDREVLVEPEPEQPVESWPRELVLRVMAEFDRATRETVMYSVVEDMTHREIASVMGCSVSLVRKRIVKFKDKAPKRVERLMRSRP